MQKSVRTATGRAPERRAARTSRAGLRRTRSSPGIRRAGWQHAGSHRRTARRGACPLKLHCARHTFASLALASGKSVRWVASQLGQANSELTLRARAPRGGTGPLLPRLGDTQRHPDGTRRAHDADTRKPRGQLPDGARETWSTRPDSNRRQPRWQRRRGVNGSDDLRRRPCRSLQGAAQSGNRDGPTALYGPRRAAPGCTGSRTSARDPPHPPFKSAARAGAPGAQPELDLCWGLDRPLCRLLARAPGLCQGRRAGRSGGRANSASGIPGARCPARVRFLAELTTRSGMMARSSRVGHSLARDQACPQSGRWRRARRSARLS